MRVRLTSWLLSATIGATLLGSAVVATAQPQVRDHRTQPPPPPPPVVRGPTSAPPPDKLEQHEFRKKGFVWQKGRWDWKNNNWAWLPGHWERAKAKSRWREGKWEQRGNEWVFVDGGWEVAPERPNMAPPPPREETIVVRPGQIFVKGHWEWDNGEYVWEPGHYETQRQAKQWREPHWEQRGNEWVFVEGAWIDAPRYPTSAPPPVQVENMPAKAGYFWVPGAHEWRNGSYVWVPGHYERERPGQFWTEGRWEQRGDHWEYVAGRWGAPPKFPTYPPPPPPDDSAFHNRGPTCPGCVWIPGKYLWKDGKYVWAGATWQPPKQPGQHVVDGAWERVGDHYEYRGQRWENDAVPPGPPPGQWRADYHGPRMPPPPPQQETISTKAGFVWARGHYDWKNDKYEWIPGHWERERAQKHWHDAEWRQQGNEWIYVEGGWQ